MPQQQHPGHPSQQERDTDAAILASIRAKQARAQESQGL